MSSNFRDVDRDTLYLLPPSLQEWLPEGHLARFVVEMVEQLDLRELEEGYRGSGKAAYHPSVLLSMLFYGYATGVFSSRRLEQASYDSVAFRFITGNTHPDHDTIAHFRRRAPEGRDSGVPGRSGEPRQAAASRVRAQTVHITESGFLLVGRK